MEGGPQVNKFEQVSSDGYHMSLARGQTGGGCPMSAVKGGGWGQWGSRREEGPGLGGLYSEVQ